MISEWKFLVFKEQTALTNNNLLSQYFSILSEDLTVDVSQFCIGHQVTVQLAVSGKALILGSNVHEFVTRMLLLNSRPIMYIYYFYLEYKGKLIPNFTFV